MGKLITKFLGVTGNNRRTVLEVDKMAGRQWLMKWALSVLQNAYTGKALRDKREVQERGYRQTRSMLDDLHNAYIRYMMMRMIHCNDLWCQFTQIRPVGVKNVFLENMFGKTVLNKQEGHECRDMQQLAQTYLMTDTKGKTQNNCFWWLSIPNYLFGIWYFHSQIFLWFI